MFTPPKKLPWATELPDWHRAIEIAIEPSKLIEEEPCGCGQVPSINGCRMAMLDSDEPRKENPYYFPLYWLVYRDPFNGLL